jgi:3-hydroxymyristoyl/3-hydroxydecanoyl-(acyl carrier protein) dehydratase
VDSFESTGDVVSGDRVDIEVSFTKRTSKMAILDGRALVHGMQVAQAALTAFFYWNSTEHGAQAPL